MSKRTMVIYRGLPASGKTTQASELAASHPERWVRINRDDLRRMAAGHVASPHFGAKSPREVMVREVKESAIRLAFANGLDVILDDTHLVAHTVKKLHQLAESWGDVDVQEIGLNVPVEECIARDALRKGWDQVGENIIRSMAKGAGLDKGRKLESGHSYYPARASARSGETHVQDPNLPKAIICDLDGTLCLLNGRNPYDASNCHLDIPNGAVSACISAMHAAGRRIIFMSGREDKCEAPTREFLENHVGGPALYDLHMRKSGDMRKDSIVKQELYEAHVLGKYNVSFVLDDRDQVVDLWRSLGLTCFQVAPGAF